MSLINSGWGTINLRVVSITPFDAFNGFSQAIKVMYYILSIASSILDDIIVMVSFSIRRFLFARDFNIADIFISYYFVHTNTSLDTFKVKV